ncbi:MAG: hypothetical protein ACQEQ0_02595 [Bacteroidota bacterium]
MKKLNFFSLMVVALIMGLSFTSCEEDASLLATDEEEEENGEDNGEDTTPKIVVTEGELEDSASTTVYVSDLEEGAEEVDVTVEFSSEEGKMRRLYMTENVGGAGDEKYELDIEDLDKKGDGSVDLSRDSEMYGFTFSIPFPVLSDISEGTVTYQVWATSGRGDYRDHEKRIVAGPGTITINYGGDNPETVDVEEYTKKLLAAPLGDGSSETFISLVDGELYRIDQGEEFAAYWDFGYYYGNTHEASLASSHDYPSSIIDIPDVANTTLDELNHTYFFVTDLSVEDFDAVENASDLDYISQSSDETVTGLAENDIIEFVDNYGKKGLIKVSEIVPGAGSNDYIELDIKVQP